MNLPDYNKYIKLKDNIYINATHKTTQFTANQIAKMFYIYCYIVSIHEDPDKTKQWFGFTFIDKTNKLFKLEYYIPSIRKDLYNYNNDFDIFNNIYTDIWNNIVTKEELIKLNNIYKKYVLIR
jgi:hypothetical protein